MFKRRQVTALRRALPGPVQIRLSAGVGLSEIMSRGTWRSSLICQYKRQSKSHQQMGVCTTVQLQRTDEFRLSMSLSPRQDRNTRSTWIDGLPPGWPISFLRLRPLQLDVPESPVCALVGPLHGAVGSFRNLRFPWVRLLFSVSMSKND